MNDNPVFGACAKHPNFAMINCPICQIEKFEMANNLGNAIGDFLNKEAIPTEIDKSVMIKLTPEEIVNLIKMGARYWAAALENKTNLTMEQVCQFHYDMAIGVLEQTDPDRFIR